MLSAFGRWTVEKVLINVAELRIGTAGGHL
jgi:hypothetical protein